MKSGVQLEIHLCIILAFLQFECDEERSATSHAHTHATLLLEARLNAMKSGVQPLTFTVVFGFVQFRLNAMKSGVQLHHEAESAQGEEVRLNAMKSGVQQLKRCFSLHVFKGFECDEERSATLWRFQLW